MARENGSMNKKTLANKRLSLARLHRGKRTTPDNKNRVASTTEQMTSKNLWICNCGKAFPLCASLRIHKKSCRFAYHLSKDSTQQRAANFEEAALNHQLAMTEQTSDATLIRSLPASTQNGKKKFVVFKKCNFVRKGKARAQQLKRMLCAASRPPVGFLAHSAKEHSRVKKQAFRAKIRGLMKLNGNLEQMCTQRRRRTNFTAILTSCLPPLRLARAELSQVGETNDGIWKTRKKGSFYCGAKVLDLSCKQPKRLAFFSSKQGNFPPPLKDDELMLICISHGHVSMSTLTGRLYLSVNDESCWQVFDLTGTLRANNGEIDMRLFTESLRSLQRIAREFQIAKGFPLPEDEPDLDDIDRCLFFAQL